MNNSKIALASISAAGEMKSSLGCQPGVLIHAAEPRIPKSRIFQSRLSFIQLTTITQRARARTGGFLLFHIHSRRGAKFGHEYQMFVQRARSIRMAEFLYNTKHHVYKRGEYYFRHVPEKGLLSLCFSQREMHNTPAV